VHYAAACPDCPGARLGTFEDLVGATKHACAFDTATIDARAFVPPSWGTRYAFGMVRRGVLIRQRVDSAGNATAVDAAGPGCVFPIDDETRSTASAVCDYAATDLIVCLCRRESLERTLDESTRTGRELVQMHRAALERVERLTQARGAGTVKQKVCGLLLALADTMSPPRVRDRLPSGVQQRDLSRLVGVRHETFCRVLGVLEREGAIAREADGLVIADRACLEALGTR
jgi:CRP-like cAMP-binding protein